AMFREAARRVVHVAPDLLEAGAGSLRARDFLGLLHPAEFSPRRDSGIVWRQAARDLLALPLLQVQPKLLGHFRLEFLSMPPGEKPAEAFHAAHPPRFKPAHSTHAERMIVAIASVMRPQVRFSASSCFRPDFVRR